MLKAYIPNDIKIKINKRSLFLLVRPFYSDGKWVMDERIMKSWNLNIAKIKLVDDVMIADFILLPYSINYYFNNKLLTYLEKYNQICISNNIKAYGFISGDINKSYPEYDNIFYFRMGGFKSQLSNKNLGFPAALSDYHKILYETKNIKLRKKNNNPIVGFCGYANSSQIKRFKECSLQFIDNIFRYVINPNRTDYETLFPSGYVRYNLLKIIEKSDGISPNIIYRKRYRAGSYSKREREKSTLEYYNNIRESDYILCIRGGGNYSRRLYETLLMGRIPILINTDCILPLEEHINWQDHVIFIDWEERLNIVDKIKEFHNSLTNEDFQNLQLKNRKLWIEKLQTNYILEKCLI